MSEKEEQVEKDLETTEEPLTEPSEEEIDAAGLSEAEVEKSEIDSLKEKKTNFCAHGPKSLILQQETVMNVNCCKNTVRKIWAKNYCQRSIIWNALWQQMWKKTKRLT